MEWVQLWESVLLRVAAALVAAGLVGRYALLPVWRGIQATKRRARELAAEVASIRAAVAVVEQITTQELTTNGGKSAKDQLNQLVEQIGVHDERLHVIGELFTAHLADGELKDFHLLEQLAEQGINVEPLQPRERWQWVNRRSEDRDD